MNFTKNVYRQHQLSWHGLTNIMPDASDMCRYTFICTFESVCVDPAPNCNGFSMKLPAKDTPKINLCYNKLVLGKTFPVQADMMLPRSGGRIVLGYSMQI